jgi:hypothetical protein
MKHKLNQKLSYIASGQLQRFYAEETGLMNENLRTWEIELQYP